MLLGCVWSKIETGIHQKVNREAGIFNASCVVAY